MADVGPFFIGFPDPGSDNYTTSGLQMNASGEGVALVFAVEKSGEIDQVLFIPSAVGSSESLTVRVETVGTNGLPTGTLYDASASGGTVATPAADTTAVATFSPTITATAGDLICVRIEFTSFSSGDVTIRTITGSGAQQLFPYSTHDSGSGDAKVTSGAPKVMLALHYTDGDYVVPRGTYPPGRISSINIQSGTTPDEVAFQYTAPVAMQLIGLSFYGREFGSTALVDFEVFDDHVSSPNSLTTNPTSVPHDSLQTNKWYTIGLEPESLSASQVINASIFSNDGSNNLTIHYLEVDNAAYWGNFARGIYWATRTDAGAFTEVTTRKPLGGLWFDEITTSGGGGFIANTNQVAG